MGLTMTDDLKLVRVYVPKSAKMVVLKFDSNVNEAAAERCRRDWERAWAQPRPAGHPRLVLLTKGVDLEIVEGDEP
jgi:hypothetical protein